MEKPICHNCGKDADIYAQNPFDLEYNQDCDYVTPGQFWCNACYNEAVADI